jgi:hypothetical protein
MSDLNRIEAAWVEYSGIAVRSGVSEAEIGLLKSAFCAGAIFVIQAEAQEISLRLTAVSEFSDKVKAGLA